MAEKRGGEKFLQAHFLGQEELPGPPNPDFVALFSDISGTKSRELCVVLRREKSELQETG